MAVARAEFQINEVEALLETLPKVLPRQSPLWRARRELARSLDAALDVQRLERENMARIRRARRVPGFDETPLTPHRREAP